MDLICPICKEPFNDDEYKVGERLGDWGYFHLDIWVKCPKCKYTPAFGKELSDAKPVYWRPENLPQWMKTAVEEAYRTHTPPLYCPFCKTLTELHKIWLHTWQKGDALPTGDQIVTVTTQEIAERFHFLSPTGDKTTISNYFIPAGILGQYKCMNHECKYVRYVTL